MKWNNNQPPRFNLKVRVEDEASAMANNDSASALESTFEEGASWTNNIFIECYEVATLMFGWARAHDSWDAARGKGWTFSIHTLNNHSVPSALARAMFERVRHATIKLEPSCLLTPFLIVVVVSSNVPLLMVECVVEFGLLWLLHRSSSFFRSSHSHTTHTAYH